MLFRFIETTRRYENFSEVPISKNGNKFLSFRAKQIKSDSSMCPEMQFTVWGDQLCKQVFELQFGDVINIEGIVKEFASVTSIEKGVL